MYDSSLLEAPPRPRRDEATGPGSSPCRDDQSAKGQEGVLKREGTASGMPLRQNLPQDPTSQLTPRVRYRQKDARAAPHTTAPQTIGKHA